VILQTDRSAKNSGGNLRHLAQVVSLKAIGSAYGPQRLRLLRTGVSYYAGQQNRELGLRNPWSWTLRTLSSKPLRDYANI
jgi:hypothetical protein